MKNNLLVYPLSTLLLLTACAKDNEQYSDSKNQPIKMPQVLIEPELASEEAEADQGRVTTESKISPNKIIRPELPPVEIRQNSGKGQQDQDSAALPEISATIGQIATLKKEKARVHMQERKRSAAKTMAAPSTTYFSHRIAPPVPVNTEKYANVADNNVKLVTSEPVSTFSVDVDTGSYANVRRFINQGKLPPANAVRAEEMINYFSYQYAAADNLEKPFSVQTEIAPSPWAKDRLLLKVGLKGYEMPADARPASNLVFLVDVSGSMHNADKLPLLKSALKMLSAQMSEKDSVSIVVYAGASGVVLEPTAGNNRAKIQQALDNLQAGGSTNGEAGINLAYAMAQQAFIKGGINRVLLATDGDFNVGTSNIDSLKNLIKQKREQGISLTTLGFGSGNYNDHLMEQIANVGNGNYAYIDSLNEARKVLVDEVGSTLQTIAKDVKIQIEFNPSVVSEYRLIGYENRALKREDFNNDKIDAGEIGAGHRVTALYEISLKDSQGQQVDPLRYQAEVKAKTLSNTQELAFLRLRYKQPQGKVSRLIELPLYQSQIIKDASETSADFRFAASVAGFAQMLKGSSYTGDFTYDNLLDLVKGSRGQDEFGYRGEFMQLVKTAAVLNNNQLSQSN